MVKSVLLNCSGLWFRRVSPIYNCFLVWRESFVRQIICSTQLTPKFCSCLLKIALVILYPDPMHESQTMNSDGLPLSVTVNNTKKQAYLLMSSCKLQFLSDQLCCVSTLWRIISISSLNRDRWSFTKSLTKKLNTEQGVRITPCAEDSKGYNYWQVY